MKVLVVGSGAYVCGRGSDGLGTILPSLFSLKVESLIDTIAVLVRSEKSKIELNDKILELNTKLATKISVEIFLSPLQEAIDIFKPNASVVSTPDLTHYEISKQLIENRIHILCVKPLVNNVKENESLIRLAKEYNVIGAVEYHKRYDHANLIAKDIILNKDIGDINNISIEYSQRKIIPEETFKEWVSDTDIFQYLGVHYVDLIHFITGAKPLEVLSIGQKNHLVQNNIENYDTITTLIKWKYQDKLFLSNHYTGWIDENSSSAMSNQKIKFFGTRGEYDSDQKNRGITLLKENGYEHINPYFSRFFLNGDSYKFDGYAKESIRNFLISSKNNSEYNIASFESSLIVSKVLDAHRKSLSSGNRWVSI